MIYNHSRSYIYKLSVLLLVTIFVVSACSVRSVQIRRAKQRYEKGQYLLSKGEVDRAVMNFEKSMKMARAVEFKEGLAHNLNELAIIHTGKGEYEKAREELREALEIYKELGMAPEVSKALSNMAVTYAREQRFQDAIKCFNDLIDWDTKTDNLLGVAITHYNMALIYYQHLGLRAKANEHFRKALKIFKETGNEKYIEEIQKNMQKR